MPRVAAPRDLLGQPLRRAPPAPEFALTCLVSDVLRRWAMPGWRWTHIPLGEERPSEIIKGKRVSFAGERLKRMGVNPGWPDFILLSPAALTHFLELKRRGRTLSDDQVEFAEYALAHGYPFVWTDKFDVALAILKGWGAVRAGISA